MMHPHSLQQIPGVLENQRREFSVLARLQANMFVLKKSAEVATGFLNFLVFPRPPLLAARARL